MPTAGTTTPGDDPPDAPPAPAHAPRVRGSRSAQEMRQCLDKQVRPRYVETRSHCFGGVRMGRLAFLLLVPLLLTAGSVLPVVAQQAPSTAPLKVLATTTH